MTLPKKRQFFGTDGIRGKANTYPMTPDMILRVAIATGYKFTRGAHRHTVVIGKDTRLSCYMVESALTAGFVAMGMDVILATTVPTPAVAFLTRSMRADLGVMISASHNPYEDNGIKFFGPNGGKLSDEEELEIEELMTQSLLDKESHSLGKVKHLEDAAGRYIEYAKSTLPRDLRLDGLKIVVDCAHGAAYRVAPKVLWELGADVISIGVQPTGTNINKQCGATHPQTLSDAVLTHQAHVGIALDGDADRLIMVDEKGKTLNGDQLIALIATFWHKKRLLKSDTVVTTVMSNLGLERYLNSQGLRLLRTPVGDRYVLEAMRTHGCNVGGEQSGHLILSDYSTTGDGLIAALQILRVMIENEKMLGELGAIYDTVPQFMRNIRVSNMDTLRDKLVLSAIKDHEKRLEAIDGRLLVRASGTEPLIRIMAEGDNEDILFESLGILEEIIKGAVK